MFAGIDDFPSVNETHIKAALPFLKSAGVPYYLHAELKPSDDSPVSVTLCAIFECVCSGPTLWHCEKLSESVLTDCH